MNALLYIRSENIVTNLATLRCYFWWRHLISLTQMPSWQRSGKLLLAGLARVAENMGISDHNRPDHPDDNDPVRLVAKNLSSIIQERKLSARPCLHNQSAILRSLDDTIYNVF